MTKHLKALWVKWILTFWTEFCPFAFSVFYMYNVIRHFLGNSLVCCDNLTILCIYFWKFKVPQIKHIKFEWPHASCHIQSTWHGIVWTFQERQEELTYRWPQLMSLKDIMWKIEAEQWFYYLSHLILFIKSFRVQSRTM